MRSFSGDGWLFGTAEPSVLVLGHLCCTTDEASEATKLLPAGLTLVDFFSSSCTNKAELQQLASSKIRAQLTVKEPVFALVGSDGAATFFTGYDLRELAGSSPLVPAAAEAAVNALHSTHIALRATPLVHLNVMHDGSAKSWGADFQAAAADLSASLLKPDKCFAVAEARHAGVVGLDEEAASRTAPYAGSFGPCGGLAPGVGAGDDSAAATTATGEEEEDDDENDDEEEEEETSRGGGGGGKKGGKKGGGGGKKGKKGGKKGGGGKRVAAAAAAARRVVRAKTAAPRMPTRDRMTTSRSRQVAPSPCRCSGPSQLLPTARAMRRRTCSSSRVPMVAHAG